MLKRRALFTLLAAGALIGGAGCVGMRVLPQAFAQAEKKDEGAQPKPPEDRTATAEERKAVTGAIETQLKAFRDDDYAKATKYQSLDLRKNFEKPEEFRTMMRRSYPQFANYKSVKFGDALCTKDGDMCRIHVTVTGKDGVTVTAYYLMVKEEGQWRVSSVLGGVRPKYGPQEIA
jgi:hypothetical protein